MMNESNELDDGMTVVQRLEDIPKFANEAEEAAFWSTHALAAHLFTRRGPRPGSLAEKRSKQRFEPHAVYSRDADAVYVYLRWGRGSKTKHLDRARLVDFADDGTVLGVQVLNVREGIDLCDLPERERVADLQKDLDVHVLV